MHLTDRKGSKIMLKSTDIDVSDRNTSSAFKRGIIFGSNVVS